VDTCGVFLVDDGGDEGTQVFRHGINTLGDSLGAVRLASSVLD
jgi:hypothetical protein